jgi:hypothetical protein
MSDYVYTSYGRMNADENDRKKAQYWIKDLNWQIEHGRKNGGFEPRDIMGMMINWIRIAQLLRDPDYMRMHYVDFIRDAAPPPKGKKASEILWKTVGKMEDYPSYAGADALAALFNEAEKAMITFINEYRKVQKTRDPGTLQYFTNYLINVSHHRI